MAQLEKAKVFMTGDLILSQAPISLAEIFSALDELGVPDDFLSASDRAQPPLQKELTYDVQFCE